MTDNNSLKDALFELTQELCRIPGAPGFEHQVVAWLVEQYRPLLDTLEVDQMGNLYGVLRGRQPGPDVLISAHSDEIGAVVRAIEPGGFLRFNKLGGMVDALLVGRKVMVGGHFGVVGVKAGHAQSEAERSSIPDYTKLYIDVGAANAEELQQMGIRIGDPITYVSEVQRFTNPDLICGKALDNRLSCLVLLFLLQRVQAREFDGNLHIVVTVQEEIGLRGARVAAFRLNPTYAIVVDTIPCGDTPDMAGDSTLPIGIGRGPVFRLVSRGDVVNLGMKQALIKAAEASGIPYQLAVHDRSTTDASAIHLEQGGIPSGIITIPRRYSHSPIEMANLNDVVATLRLLEVIVQDTVGIADLLEFI